MKKASFAIGKAGLGADNENRLPEPANPMGSIMFVRTAKRDRSFATGYLFVTGFVLFYAAFGQPGMHWGFFQVRGFICTEDTNACFDIRAESERVWHWAVPTDPNHRYTRAKMEVRSPEERTVSLDLREGMWTVDGKTGPLEAEVFARLLDPNWTRAKDPQFGAEVAAMLRLLEDLGDGKRPPSGDHGYGTHDLTIARITCFNDLGSNYGPAGVLVCLLLWPAYLLLPRAKRGAGWLTARRAFAIAFVASIALTLLFVGVRHIFSPGGVSEAMEALIGLVNLPISGDRAVLYSPLLWVGSALVWGVLFSACVSLVKGRSETVTAKEGSSENRSAL